MAGETDVYIGLGANLGDREPSLRAALRRLGQARGVTVVATSEFIETAPVACPAGSPAFLNGVAHLRTSLSARELLRLLLEVERSLGRDRASGATNRPRTVDLDLLLYGDAIIDERDLTVPHPRMGARKFVLAPLAQVAPDARDPRTGVLWTHVGREA